MATKHFCDFCGKQVSHYNLMTVDVRSKLRDNTTYDICQECKDKIFGPIDEKLYGKATEEE